ncbi:MAG: RcpC/CpaB family pilus assembly protein [Phycisphaeraceae bacterium JB051]
MAEQVSPGAQSPRQQENTKLVIAAVFMAALAVILTNIYISQIKNQNELESFKVYVLKIPMSPGDRLRSRDVEEINVPDTQKFRKTFDQMGYMDKESLDLRISLKEPFQRSVNAGEILLFRHFTTPDSSAIDQKITPGKRLKVLSINSKTVPGALRVGMFVDLEAAFNTQFGVQVLPVMERVKVIALGTATSYEAATSRVSASRFSSITIEVTPEQATQMNLIERVMIGDFDLTVRNPSDTAYTKIPSGGINPSVVDLVERRRPAIGATRDN